MKVTPRLLREARHARNTIIASIILGLMGGILGIFQAREISLVINRVFLRGSPLESVSFYIALILVIVLLRAGFAWGGERCASVAASRIKQDLRTRLISHIQDLGPAYLRGDTPESGTQTGELVNLATEGIDALEVYFSQYLPQIALAALIPLTILVFVFPLDPLSGLILLLTAPLLPLFMYLIGSAAEALTRRQWLGLSRMSAYFLDILQGLTTLKSLGRSRDQIKIIKKVSENYRQTTMQVLKITFLSAMALELIATLSTAVVAVEIGLRLLYGRLAFEQAFFILILAPELYLPLRLLGTRFHAGMAGVEAAKKIFRILDLPLPARPDQAGFNFPPLTRQNAPPSIVLKDVSFAFSKNPPAIDKVSVEIPAGKITAIIGESGAGKTTFTWLLMGLLQPQNGEILVDGEALHTIPLERWHETLAWASQNPYLLNDTVAANIRLSKPEADSTSIQQAACSAHADEFINALPQGYETIIGEHGLRLSAGQAQRIALARAFLKDAPLLILDEATSHLDPETDALLQATLKDLSHGRTVLVIAHRRPTLAMADQVIRLSHGKAFKEDISSTPVVRSMQDGALPAPTYNHQDQVTPISLEPAKGGVSYANQPSVEGRLLRLLSPFIGRVLLSVALGFATIASGIGLMATAAYIISAAALHPSIAELQVAIVGVRFFGLSRGVFRYLERLVSHDLTFRLLARWRVWFYQALEPLAPARLLLYHSGDLLARVIRDIGSLESFYVRSVAPPLVALLVSIAGIALLVNLSGLLALGLCVFLILAGVGLPYLTFIASRRLGPAVIRSRSRLNAILVDTFQGMPDILTCSQGKQQLARLNQAGEQLTAQQSRMAGVTSLQTALGGLLANLGMLAVLVLAIEKASLGQLNGVFLGVVTLIALTSFEALQTLPIVSLHLESNRAAADRLYELVDATPCVVDPVQPVQPPKAFSLQIEGLSFNYPSTTYSESAPEPSSVFQLREIGLSLPKGKHIGLIGPNGAGKTTLINLLLRFWEYQQGSILLGNNELRQYRQEDIRKQIAVISQNTYLFSATIKENLLIARPNASEDEIIRASKQAHLHDLVQSLPAGYDTWIGENGLRLSAGERQRLAIARALLKDAPLLILDEPTANLDPTTELAVLESLHVLSEGRSTITVTQRMVELEALDEILVMQNGQIVERGSHDQLLIMHGLYSRMWDLYHQIL